MDSGLADLLASSRLTFRWPHVVSICLDVAKFGKPFKEFLVVHQSMQPGNHNFTLPPKEILEGGSSRRIGLGRMTLSSFFVSPATPVFFTAKKSI